jgi:P27 family predicted phage terminase small subunit
MATKEPTIRPPSHLRKATARWWLDVVDAYEMEPSDLKLLTLAAESFDRCCQAREAIKKEGLIYYDRFGAPHQRPECQIERDSKFTFARIVKQLGIAAPDTPEVMGYSGSDPYKAIRTGRKTSHG